MTTNRIQRHKTTGAAVAVAAAGASLLLAAPSASAVVTGPLTVTPSAQFTIPILTDAGHGTTCSYELGATAGAIGDEATFKVERWDAEAVPPAFVAEPSLGPTAGAVAAGDVLTEVWVPQAVGTYKFTLDGTTETVEVKVTNAVDILGFVCILLPEM